MNSLWIDFVNSRARDPLGQAPDRDRLQEPDWLGRFLEQWSLPRIDARSRAVQAALGELRELLQQLVTRLVDDGPLRPADLATLNRYLAARPVTSRLEIEDDAFRFLLIPQSRGLDAVLFAIAQSFAAFLVQGEPERLKTCDNPDCRWVFYDTTRSRTRRWCADSCGNLMKVRKFRRKKKGSAKGKPGRSPAG